MVRPNNATFNFDLLNLFIFLAALDIILILLAFVIFSWDIKNSHKSIIICKQKLCVEMVIKSMNNSTIIIMELIKLEWLLSWILV